MSLVIPVMLLNKIIVVIQAFCKGLKKVVQREHECESTLNLQYFKVPLSLGVGLNWTFQIWCNDRNGGFTSSSLF